MEDLITRLATSTSSAVSRAHGLFFYPMIASSNFFQVVIIIRSTSILPSRDHIVASYQSVGHQKVAPPRGFSGISVSIYNYIHSFHTVGYYLSSISCHSFSPRASNLPCLDTCYYCLILDFAYVYISFLHRVDGPMGL